MERIETKMRVEIEAELQAKFEKQYIDLVEQLANKRNISAAAPNYFIAVSAYQDYWNTAFSPITYDSFVSKNDNGLANLELESGILPVALRATTLLLSLVLWELVQQSWFTSIFTTMGIR